MNGAKAKDSGEFSKDLTTEEEYRYGAAYDSIITLGRALNKLVKDKKTFTGVNIQDAIANEGTKLTGLTGELEFSAEGERIGYKAMLSQLDKDAAQANYMRDIKVLEAKSALTPRQIEHDFNKYKQNQKDITSRLLEKKLVDGIKAAIPDTFNISNTNFTLWNKITVYTDNDQTETILSPPKFWCSKGCGKAPIDPSDTTKWSGGTCIEQDVCKCVSKVNKPDFDFTGDQCETPRCKYNCGNGACISPGVCKCNEGYADDVSKESYPEEGLCAKAVCDRVGCHPKYGECTGPNTCVCKAAPSKSIGYYKPNCAGKCDCGEHGECTGIGPNGDGSCTCDGGWTGEKCDKNVAGIATGSTFGTIFLIVLLGLLLYYLMKRMQEMEAMLNMDWKANWDDIRVRQSKNKSSIKSLISVMSMMSAKSGKANDKVVCQNQGTWNGKEIVIKQLNRDDVEMTKVIKEEIKEMKDISHPNLCQFIGAVVESPNVAILNEVCGKGSLEDVLYNDDVDLGWDFRFSLLKDIARGLQYLHNTSIGSHGRLKSSNCLVDNKWTCKIADFGMKEFKKNQIGVRVFEPSMGIGLELPTEEELDQCDYYNLLWTAPEILRQGVSHLNHVQYGTREADIYSYGVIMAEMCNLNHPFCELDYLGPDEIVPMLAEMTPMDSKMANIVSFKMSNDTTAKSFRPNVPPELLPAETEMQGEKYFNLLTQCWHHDPFVRPLASEIGKELNAVAPHRGDLSDNLIDLMTTYSTNLEMVISERTQDMMAEKEASDALLMKMLPPLIAAELKSGNNPVPEFFNCITLYFSDVVGFTKICNESNPVDVVNLLNHLYGILDETMEPFDCYKVETIADSYVVASGLPIRNGDRHAGEVATMALTLLSAVNDVSYAHIPGSQIQLRIGINSGPIVAGVVGLKMPRYCLFGDTINIASRMESGGYALKIHMSEHTHKILDQEPGLYICESRGVREIKGKGSMTTYWLQGKKGLDLVYPSEDKAASLSLHEFK